MDYLELFNPKHSVDVYSENTLVARVRDNMVGVVNYDLCPNVLRSALDFNYWVDKRCMDLNRPNSRLLKKVLGIKTSNPVNILRQVNGACITDCWWFKSPDSELSYEEVRFNSDKYYEVSLYGESDYRIPDTKKVPHITATGSYDKGWRRFEDKWYLQKKGEPLQLESEIFTYRLGKPLGLNMAEYEKCDDGRTVLSKNFAETQNYEEAIFYIGEEEDELLFINLLSNLNEQLINQYLDILFLDTIVRNPDRHNQNFGFLRNRHSGEIESLAPNYDNNLSLFSTGIPSNLSRRNDILVRSFLDVLDSRGFTWEIPYMDELMIGRALEGLPNLKNVESDVIEFCMNAYKQLV